MIFVRFAFTAFLTEFFHADGNGLSEEKLNCPNAEILESELKMRSAKTRDLIKLFYMQVGLHESMEAERIFRMHSGFMNYIMFFFILSRANPNSFF